MAKVTFQPMNKTVEAEDGESILEAAHRNHVPLEGACEGSLACSTCHVIVAKAWFDKLEEPSEEEEDVLDEAFGVSFTSRCGCKIMMSPELDGIEVTIPEYSVNMYVDKKG
ncbi:MAG: 2Fe-2S iron-sulfur cluster binding domain-containing protein [Magnetococcales bacterium]|nr:2Fe-2S iron-sulfur cluster binding domain-containing protein [Magnetococcales bacterium]